MAFQTKQSRMAIVAETSEGVLKAPSAGSDYLAIQDGFSTELGMEPLDNAEIKASIGMGQKIPGFETGSASISHYLRHSGVEGQAPQSGYSKLLKAAYGSETVYAVEYDTVAASTVSVVKVDVGEGVNFAVGQALLVKHAAHPYEIGVIKEIAGDDLTMLFNLQYAPAVGTALGKAVSYRAADSGHPTLSVWDYRGNGAAIAAVAGCRVTELGITAEAGGLINAAFSLEGIANYWDPIEVLATDIKLDFLDDVTTRVATISAKMYKSPIDLAAALQSAMNALGSTNTFTVSYSSSTGKFTISSNGTTLSLLWNTGVNKVNTVGDKLGFVLTADDTGALTYTSDTALVLSSPQTPAFDSPGTPIVAKYGDVFLGTATDNVLFCTSDLNYTLSLTKKDEMCIAAESGKNASVVSGREVTVTMTASVPQYKADLFYAFVNAQGLSFQYSGGPKVGGGYVAGTAFVLAIKDCAVTVHNLGDADGLVTLELELSGFVDSNGTSETYLNLL